MSINIAGRGECVHADPNKHMCWEPDSCGEDRPFMCRAAVDRAKSDHCKIQLCTVRNKIDVLAFQNIWQNLTFDNVCVLLFEAEEIEVVGIDGQHKNKDCF